MATLRLMAAALTAVAAASASGGQLELQVEPGATEVRVSGARPGESVLWFSVGRSRIRHATRISPMVVVSQPAAQSGSVTVHLPEPVREDALWACIGRTGGGAAAGSVGNNPPRWIPRTSVSFPRGRFSDGGAPEISIPAAFLHAVLVRPGSGVWHVRAGDGGPEDVDRSHDGVITLGDLGWQPVEPETTGSTGGFQSGDLLVAIDPDQVSLLVYEFVN